MFGRSRISGRHFSLMAAIVRGEAIRGVSSELSDLKRWGYVDFDGTDYTPTEAGKKVFDTWENMEGS